MPVVRCDDTHNVHEENNLLNPIGYLDISRGCGTRLKLLDLAKKSLYGLRLRRKKRLFDEKK